MPAHGGSIWPPGNGDYARQQVSSAPAVVRLSAPAKVNFTLRVIGKRGDGYHLLDSIVAPIGLFDRVTVRVERAGKPYISLRCTPLDAAPEGSDNIAAKAAALFLSRARLRAAVTIELAKRIPSGAGLGGGSSNAAAVLRALNSILPKPHPESELLNWALELGADVPFFLFGQPVRMRGIGEVLEYHPLSIPSSWALVLCFPKEGLSTGSVYGAFDRSLTERPRLGTMTRFPFYKPKLQATMLNDLEAAAFILQPTLGFLKRQLLNLGAAVAMMTGSGSTLFGIWTESTDARRIAAALRQMSIEVRVVRILSRVPAIERLQPKEA